MRTIQLALLQQQYPPNHPPVSKNQVITTPTIELASLNVGSSEFGSDKVTIGDATSVLPTIRTMGNCRFKEDSLFLRLRRQCRGHRL